METKKSDKFLSTLEAAQKGDADAQFALGVMYKHGIGVAQDYPEAFKYYKQAADQGNIDAQFALGDMYKHSIGIAQDYEQALNIISWLLSREILMHKSN